MYLPTFTGRLCLPPLSKELRQKYSIRSMHIQKDEVVQIMQGHCKGQQIGNVAQAYGKKYVTYTD